MKHSLKYVLLAHLISSAPIAFADLQAGAKLPSQVIKPNKSDLYQTYSRIKIKEVKVIPASSEPLHETVHFKPFIAKNIVVTLDGIEIDLKTLTSTYEKKTLNTESLATLEDEITEYFIAQDYLLPQVHISQAEIKKHGLLKITVTLNPIKNVIIKGENENNSLIQAYADKILAETPAKVSTTQRYLALMNHIPGYDINYTLNQDHQNHNNVDLIIFPKTKKFSTYVGLDNYGLKDFGRYQGSIVSQAYSPFGYNESLLIHASTTNHPNRLSDIGAGYSQPINAYGTSLHLAYSYSMDNATRNTDIVAPNNPGSKVKVYFTHELLLKPHQQLEAEVGAAYKHSKAHAIVNDVAQLYKESDYWTGDIGLKYSLKDKFEGRTLASLHYIKGLGGKFKNHVTAANIADQHFNLVKFDLYRDQELPNDFSIFSHFAIEYSADKLPDSYKTSIGGRDFGRGYDFSSISGTKSIGFSVEGRYTKHIDNKFIRHMQPYAFYDIGYIRKKDSGASVSSLQSAGIGLRFRMQQGIDFGLEGAQPFKKAYNVQGNSQKARAKLSVFLNKIFEF